MVHALISAMNSTLLNRVPEQAGKCCVGRLLASLGEASSPPRGCLTIAYAADSTIAQVLTCRYRLQGVQPLAPAPRRLQSPPWCPLAPAFLLLASQSEPHVHGCNPRFCCLQEPEWACALPAAPC